MSKARTRTKEHEYVIVSASGSIKTITARNIQEAYDRAGRLFPRAKLITVSRKASRTGREYETYIINRHKR